MQLDGRLDGITRVMTEARSQVSAIVSVCVFNEVMRIVMSGPEGQISELRLTQHYDAVATLCKICRCIYMVYFSAILLNFFAKFYLLLDFIV